VNEVCNEFAQQNRHMRRFARLEPALGERQQVEGDLARKQREIDILDGEGALGLAAQRCATPRPRHAHCGLSLPESPNVQTARRTAQRAPPIPGGNPDPAPWIGVLS